MDEEWKYKKKEEAGGQGMDTINFTYQNSDEAPRGQTRFRGEFFDGLFNAFLRSLRRDRGCAFRFRRPSW